MRIPSGVTDQYIYFVAVDATDFTTRETGLSSFTVYRSRDGGAAAAMTTPTINETDSTNMPGVYELLLDEDMTIGSGNDTEEMSFHITHAGMAPVTRVIELYRPKITTGETLTVSSGAVSTVTTLTGHTAQTGDNYARLGAPAGASISVDIADIPTVSEFNARTLVAADYFDPSADTVANVTTVATTTTNTDMRGTDNAALASVLGSLTDAAATGDPTITDTAMQYIKQLINILVGTAGIGTFPAEAAPANAVSLAEVIRAIHTDVTGLNGDAMRGTDSAALATTIGTPAGADLVADIADIPTVSEFNARTLASASYFDPAADTVATVTDVTNLHASAATAANQTTILNRLGAFTGSGVNTILGFFQAALRSDGTDPSDLGGTYAAASDSLQAVRDRGDTAWITGGGGGLTQSIKPFFNVPTSIDLANTATVRISIILTNALDDLPTTAEITPGTISIHRKAIGGTSWSAIVTDGAMSESGGQVYYDEVFDSGAGYAEGDSIRFTFKSVSVTADANTYVICDTAGVMFQTEIRQTERGTDSASTHSAADVWTSGTRTLTANTNLNDPTVAQIADGVWDEAKAGHVGAGSFGEEVQAHALSSEITALNDPSAVDIRTEIDSNSTQLSAIVADTNELQGDWTNGGRLDLLLDAVLADTNELQTDWANGGRLDLILDAILAKFNDTRAEPGQGAPEATIDPLTKLDYLYKAWRNKKDNDGSTTNLYADDTTTIDQKQTTSESAGTVTKDEWVTGPQMAIDTNNKKLGVMEWDNIWEPAIPLSPGTFGEDDKQQLLWGYPGILWSEIVEPIEDNKNFLAIEFRDTRLPVEFRDTRLLTNEQ